jgi:HSP20 family protein
MSLSRAGWPTRSENVTRFDATQRFLKEGSAMQNRTTAWTTWNPWADFVFLQDRLDRLAQEAFGAKAQTSVYTLPLDAYETADEFILQSFVPGLRAEHLDIHVDNGVLTISGSYPQLYDADDARGYAWHARELRGGRFQRSVALPVKVDVEHANAEIHDGILRLVFPKAAEAKPRRIQVMDSALQHSPAQLTELTSQQN